jgi:Helix-turn-helix domain
LDQPTKNRVWELLGAGLDCPAVARSLHMNVDTVRAIAAKRGGVRPRPRHRSRRVLSLEQREEISRGLAEGVSLREIAKRLGRAVHDLARGRPQRRPEELPGPQSRPGSLATGRASEGGQARHMPEVGSRGGAALEETILTAPDLGVVG